MNKKLLFISLSLIFLLSAPSIFAETSDTSTQNIADIPAGTAEEYFNRGIFSGNKVISRKPSPTTQMPSELIPNMPKLTITEGTPM